MGPSLEQDYQTSLHFAVLGSDTPNHQTNPHGGGQPEPVAVAVVVVVVVALLEFCVLYFVN